MVDDHLNAFIDADLTIAGAGDGPLAGLRFAVKDAFDIAGEVTGAGNPDWKRTHDPATATAPAVEQVLAAGATLVGKTITDELTYSLLGVNIHYGTPENPPAPDSIPGGSSSGSASAVAGGLVDVALGTDTGGSVRVPASLCGIYGFRPTHGATDTTGVFPNAPSCDTVGWFARDPLHMWQLASVLLPAADAAAPALDRLVVADDVFTHADDPVVDILFPTVERLSVRFAAEHVPVLAADGLDVWAETFRILQGAELWPEHRDWLESTNPKMALEVRDRLDALRLITDAEITRARAMRDQITSQLHDLLGRDGLLVLPTVPEIAPLLDSTDDEFKDFRRRTIGLTCIATLAGLPQITIPVAHLAEYPVGISLIGGPGTDHHLIALAATVARPAT